MDVTRSSDMMNGGTGLHVPSGFEVESASFTPPAPASRSWKEKLVALPQSTTTQLARVKPMMSSRVTNVKTKVNGSMRGNPTMWAGVAAGAGLGIGLIGRLLHHRAHHNKGMPAIVIIDAAC
jgi:hypothetical protein